MCPACATHLSLAAGFPGGLGGSFVRVACPVASCGSPLVAWVFSDHEVELMTPEEGLDAARHHAARRNPKVPVLRVLVSLAMGAVLTLLRMRAHPTQAVHTLMVGAVAFAAFFGALALLRRRRAARDGERLLGELPELPRALEPTTRAYR